jgi:hypothetical protein
MSEKSEKQATRFICVHHPYGRFTIGNITIKFQKEGFRGVFETTDAKIIKLITESKFFGTEIIQETAPEPQGKKTTKVRFQCLPDALNEKGELTLKKYGKIKFDGGFFETTDPGLIVAIQKLPGYGQELGTLSDDDGDSIVTIAAVSTEQI